MTTPELSRWTHNDTEIGVRLQMAEDRALAADWTNGTASERAAELRALVIGTAYQMGKLQGTVQPIELSTGQVLVIDPRAKSAQVPEPRRRAAATLYRSLSLLARGSQQAGSFETYGPPPIEAGALPALATIAIVVVGGAAIAYLGHEAAKVVDRYLSRSEQSARLAQSHAAAQQLVEAHTDREDQQGKQLPLDEATRAALDNLRQEQNSIAETVDPPFGGDINLPTGSPWTFSTGALVALTAGAGLWLASKTGVI